MRTMVQTEHVAKLMTGRFQASVHDSVLLRRVFCITTSVKIDSVLVVVVRSALQLNGFISVLVKCYLRVLMVINFITIEFISLVQSIHCLLLPETFIDFHAVFAQAVVHGVAQEVVSFVTFRVIAGQRLTYSFKIVLLLIR